MQAPIASTGDAKKGVGNYLRVDCRADLLAGLTVSVMGVPQAMAYAMIAGLPPVYGLYTSIVTCAVAAILDWEDAAFGDPLSDVACCRVELRYKFGKASMQRFTEAYARDRVVDRERLALWQVYVAAAAQRFMGKWGLAPALEAHMRTEALASIREAGAALMGQI